MSEMMQKHQLLIVDANVMNTVQNSMFSLVDILEDNISKDVIFRLKSDD